MIECRICNEILTEEVLKDEIVDCINKIENRLVIKIIHEYILKISKKIVQ